MNEHLPRSGGFPLRAMIMLLLFLGVIFLLVGIQTLRTSSSHDDEDPAIPTVVATPSTTNLEDSEINQENDEIQESQESSPLPKPDIRVYNISDQDGLAGETADRLREANFDVTEVGNLELTDTTETTVYYGDAPGERETAEEIGRLLNAKVEPRSPGVAEQPPGVIVVVARSGES